MRDDMDIETYYRTKGPYPGLTRAEALIRGIPFPLKPGSLRKHGSHAIRPAQEQALAEFAVHRRTRTSTALSKLDNSQLNLFGEVGNER
jgi:hypothetical protein